MVDILKQKRWFYWLFDLTNVLDICETSYKGPKVREQGWAIWRGKRPNLRNKRDKTLKNFTCLHDFNILYKKTVYLLRGRGRLQMQNTHPVTVIGTTLSDNW